MLSMFALFPCLHNDVDTVANMRRASSDSNISLDLAINPSTWLLKVLVKIWSRRDFLKVVGRNLYGVPGGMLPWNILNSRVSEMPFPAFWGNILQNSEGRKTSHITKF